MDAQGQPPQHHALQAFLIAAVVAPFSYYAGAAAQRLHLPRISGYLISGVALGPYALGVLSSSSVSDLSVVEGACLAVIGVAAGAELHWGELARAKRAVVALTLAICAATWGVCFAAVVAAAAARPSVLWLSRGGAGANQVAKAASDLASLTSDNNATTTTTTIAAAAPLIPYASLAATLAMARSPASAIAVLRELDARGPFSSMVMGVTVLKDVIVIVAFAINVQFVSMAAKAKAAAAAATAAAGTAAGGATNAAATTTTITASAARLFLLPLLSVAVSVSIGMVGGMLLSIAMSRPVAVRLAAAAARAAAVVAGAGAALAALFAALVGALSSRFGGGGIGGGIGGSSMDRAGSLGGPTPPLPLVIGDGGATTTTAAALTAQHLARCKEASLLLLSTAVFTLTRALDAEPLLACVTMGLVAGNRAFAQLILGPGAGGGGCGGGGVDASSSSSAAAAAASALAKAPSGGVPSKARVTDGDGDDDHIDGAAAIAAADGNDGDDRAAANDEGDHGHHHADGDNMTTTAETNTNDLSHTANAVMSLTNVAFFGLAGASLRLPAVVQSAWLAGALVAARLVAIRLGCALGATAGGVKAPEHRRLFWRAMVTQAGVALGLARIAGTAFGGWGPHFQTAMTGVVMVNLAIGPPLFRSALLSVGEASVGGWGGSGGRGGRRGGSVPLIPLGGKAGGGGGGGGGGAEGGARRR